MRQRRRWASRQAQSHTGAPRGRGVASTWMKSRKGTSADAGSTPATSMIGRREAEPGHTGRHGCTRRLLIAERDRLDEEHAC